MVPLEQQLHVFNFLFSSVLKFLLYLLSDVFGKKSDVCERLAVADLTRGSVVVNDVDWDVKLVSESDDLFKDWLIRESHLVAGS